MALQKTITLQDNFGEDRQFADAYIKVSKVSGSKENMEAVVDFRKSEDSGILKTKGYFFTPSLDGDNFIKQAYEHLKTLPEFAGSTDV